MVNMRILTMSLIAVLVHAIGISGQQIEWVKSYGGTLDDHGVRIIQTPDSGFAFLGRSFSFAVAPANMIVLSCNCTAPPNMREIP